MSYYSSYNFISPEGVYATVAEELKGYLDTGAVDQLLWPTYLNKCLNKLGKATYSIVPTILYIEDFQSRLPDNFYGVREAWLCTEINGFPYQEASSFYSQAASATTIQIAPMTIGGVPCTNPECTSGCDECMPNLVQAVYKTNNALNRTFQRQYLLKPGNISVKNVCDVDYMANWEMYAQPIPSLHSSTPYSSGYDSFDIRDNKFVTNFRTGVVNLVFYATDYDETGNQLIPDNFRIKQYIEDFLKFKVFETLSNQVTDETFNQIQQKMVYYKQLADEAYIIADTEIKKQPAWEKQRRIKQSLNRFNMYQLPNRNNYRNSRNK